ncbi:MAG: riboflavin synthase [Candidatus Omnitrophica bacterium]|nr:riboflavin synthase [Candidatus Omnitrophota bacterium]MDD5310315.1 riboflavin synthase [Candidatus Omnitrophota bacterium]MDD5545860.1 riboflavin synthase [Candidatus Omnitrophota bacterium]
MFTGIIEELGVVEKIDRSSEPSVFTVKAGKVLEGLKKGDSVSVNGACLTVVATGKGNFSVEAIRETLKNTCLGDLKKGEKVNLEGALVSGGKVSGHFVTGHVDGTGIIKSKKEGKGEILLEIKAAGDILDGIVLKGSVAVDGVSLTVAELNDGSFSVYVIPHTARATTLGSRKAGDKVNLETDMLGKYAAKYPGREKPSNITEEFLKDKGFI